MGDNEVAYYGDGGAVGDPEHKEVAPLTGLEDLTCINGSRRTLRRGDEGAVGLM